ncbi:MAG: inner membrane CreD family protein [Caulobacteraceae bacterium]
MHRRGLCRSWRVPFVARGIEKAADLGSFNLGLASGRDMAVSFVSSDNIYQGVARAVRYGIMFIGIVFLATLIFEAVSGRKAHPAQYILVGLAQCVFYLLLLSMTEIIGFTPAFLMAAAATVALLGYYAGASFQSGAVGARAFVGLAALYGAMYVLMTLEDFALFAGSVVAFAVIAATMIATRRIDWYGRGAVTPAAAD